MQIIDRNNSLVAEKYIDALFKHLGYKNVIIEFLSRKIEYANSLNSDNWNLNLDLNGKFLRFNVGQEYCIEIKSSECLILCMKDSLPLELNKSGDIEFRGYNKKLRTVQLTDISSVPDLLVKVPNSIGCVIKKKIDELLPVLGVCRIERDIY